MTEKIGDPTSGGPTLRGDQPHVGSNVFQLYDVKGVAKVLSSADFPPEDRFNLEEMLRYEQENAGKKKDLEKKGEIPFSNLFFYIDAMGTMIKVKPELALRSDLWRKYISLQFNVELDYSPIHSKFKIDGIMVNTPEGSSALRGTPEGSASISTILPYIPYSPDIVYELCDYLHNRKTYNSLTKNAISLCDYLLIDDDYGDESAKHTLNEIDIFINEHENKNITPVIKVTNFSDAITKFCIPKLLSAINKHYKEKTICKKKFDKCEIIGDEIHFYFV